MEFQKTINLPEKTSNNKIYQINRSIEKRIKKKLR